MVNYSQRLVQMNMYFFIINSLISWILSKDTGLRTLAFGIGLIFIFLLVYFLEFLQWWGNHYLTSSKSLIILLSKISVRLFFLGAVIFLPIDSYHQPLFSLGLQNCYLYLPKDKLSSAGRQCFCSSTCLFFCSK